MTDWLTRKAEAEREWFKQEHERQFGKPPISDEDVALRKVVAKFERLSRKKVCERKHFVPNVELPPPLAYVAWDAPLALHCVCPTGDCTCTCKGNTLLPKKRLPIIPRYNWWGVRPVLCKLHIVKRPKPAGDLARNFAEAVKKESEFYKSKQGREILTERGPEFCLSGCLKFYITNKNIQKDYVKVIAEMKKKMVPRDAPVEVQEEQDTKKGWSDRICDQFRCTVSTQSQVDVDGEFIIGDYSHLLFGMPEEEFLCDIEGAELNVASYKGPVCAPRESVFLGVVKTADKLFHVTDIKQRISQVKKDLITSIFEIREKHLSKASQYECKDLPIEVPEGVCESLADVRRKRREKECLEKNKIPVEEKVETQDATCYCKFRYKQVSKDMVKKSQKENEVPKVASPVKPMALTASAPMPLPSKSNLKPPEETPCPPCMIKVCSNIKENKSLSDAGKRVKIDLSQTGKGSKDKVEVGKQTSFIGSLKVSYDESTNIENDKINTIMPEGGKKVGVRFSKEVATDILPEFYGHVDDDFDIVSQESSITQMDNIVEPFKDQDNQTSVELINKVMKDASILIEPEKKLVHKTISTVRSVELVILRPDAECAKGKILTGTSNTRVSSCTPCNQEETTKRFTGIENNVSPDYNKTKTQEDLKASNELNLKDDLKISDNIKENTFSKLTNASRNIKEKTEIETESIGKVLKEMKKTYKDGTCQPCDKLLKIAKYINKALSEPSEDAESKELQAIGDIKDKIKSTGKADSTKLAEGSSAPNEKLRDSDEQVKPLAAKSIDVSDGEENIIKKELSTTEKFKVSSTDHNAGTLTKKPSSKDSLLQSTTLGKEASNVDELKEISSKASDIDFQPRKPSSKGRISESVEMKTEASKTGELKKETSTDSKIDSQIRKLSSVSKVSSLAELENDVSKIEELKEGSSVESKIYSKTDKPSSKDRLSISANEKQTVSKTDQLELESMTKSEVDTHKVRSKDDLTDVKKEISGTGEVREASSIESKIDSQVQSLGSKGSLLVEEQQDESKVEKLKDISTKGSNIDTQAHKPNSKDELPELLEVEKEVSKTDELKQTSSIESKTDSHELQLGSKGRISKAAEVEEDVSRVDELENVSRTGSKIDTQVHKPSRTEVPSELTDSKNEVSKTKELQKTSIKESKMDFQDSQLSIKSSISKTGIVKEEVSKSDELVNVSSTGSKVDIQTHKPSSIEGLTELPDRKKGVSKTENLEEISSIESKTDFQDQELGSKGKITEATQIKEASKADELKDTSNIGSKIDTQTRRPSSKGVLPESIEIKKEVSTIEDLKKSSSTENKMDSETLKPSSKDRSSETARVKEEISEADELKDISNMESQVGTKTHKTKSKDDRPDSTDVQKAHSKTEELKNVSSQGSKMRAQAQKPSIRERLSGLTKVIKDVSNSHELNDISSTLCKINSKTKRPSCMGRFSELSELENVSKTEELNHGLSRTDTETRKPKSKGWFSKLKEKIKEKSKANALKDSSSIMCHSDSQAQKPTSKDGVSKLKKEDSKTDELHVVSSIMCHSDSEVQKQSSKTRLSELKDAKKEISKTDKLKEISSIESKLDTQTEKPGSRSRISKLVDRKVEKEKSETDNLKDISSIESKVDTQNKEPGGKSGMSDNGDKKKEKSEADKLQEVSSIESEADAHIKKTDGKGGISEFADRKKDKSEPDDFQEISSVGSKVGAQIHEPGSDSRILKLADRKKEKFEADELQETSSIESKVDTEIHKPGKKSRISEFIDKKKKKSEADELQGTSSIKSKLDSEIHKPGSKNGTSEFADRKKKKSEADELQETSSIGSKVDSEIHTPGSKSRISKLADRKKEKSEDNELQEISSGESKIDTKSKKLSIKGKIPELTFGKKEKSDTDKLKESSSIESEFENQSQKTSTKRRLSDLTEVSKSDKIIKISSTESQIDTVSSKPSSKNALKGLTKIEKEVSKTEKLKEVFSIESQEDSEARKPSSEVSIPDLKEVKKELSKTEKLNPKVKTHTKAQITKNGSQGSTEEATKVSKSEELIKDSNIESKFDYKTQKLSTRGGSSELAGVKQELSNIDKLNVISKTKMDGDNQTQKLSNKDSLPELTRVKKEVSDTDELKELYSTDSKIDAKIDKRSSKQILPQIKKAKKVVSKIDQLKTSAEFDVSIQTRKSISKEGSLQLTDVKKEASKSTELKEVLSAESIVGTGIKKPSTQFEVPKLTRVKQEDTKLDELKKITKTESKTDTRKPSTKEISQEKEKQKATGVTKELGIITEGPGISKGTTSTTQPKRDDIKNAPKDTKQELPAVSGPCPVKKLTNLKNTIKRFLVPEDIPKVCKDAACQPCHKLKGLEKVVHKAFSDLEHSEVTVVKNNTEKESDAKKKAEIVISQLSIEGNSGRVNALNQTLSTEFAEAFLCAPRLDETNKILESYINSDHKQSEGSRAKKSARQKANENNTIQTNKIVNPRDFYLAPLEKLMQLKEFIKSQVIPTGPKRCIDSSFQSHKRSGKIKRNVESVISPFHIENKGNIRTVKNTPQINLKDIPNDVPTPGRSNVTKDRTNNNAFLGKSVPILKPPHKNVKSSEKVKQTVSFKDNPEYNSDECEYCKSCDEYCCKSQKNSLNKSESFNKNLGAYNVTSHEKLNSASISKRGTKKAVRKIYNKMSHFNWKSLFSYPLGEKNLEIDQVLSECFDAKKSDTNETEFRNDCLKLSEEEIFSRDLDFKNNVGTDLKPSSINKDRDTIVRKVVYDNKQYYGNAEDSVISTQNLNKSYRFYY